MEHKLERFCELIEKSLEDKLSPEKRYTSSRHSQLSPTRSTSPNSETRYSNLEYLNIFTFFF
jgi:hypothetical protein